MPTKGGSQPRKPREVKSRVKKSLQVLKLGIRPRGSAQREELDFTELKDADDDALATLHPGTEYENSRYENAPNEDLLVLNALVGVDWQKYNFTARQRRFIEFYCADPASGTAAALAAGYSPGCATVEASYALRNPYMTAVIAQVMNARIERTALTKDKVLHTLEILMTAEPDDFTMIDGQVSVKEGRPKYLTRAIKAIEYIVEKWIDVDGVTREERRMKVTLYDKAAVLRMAGQYHKMFTDIQEINHRLEVVQTWKIGTREITF